MRKISKHKKEIRNGVRVDNTYSNLLRQFDLSGSSTKVGSKAPLFRRLTARPSSILYICLILGLSIGIGSAFADREIFPSSQKPLDQPAEHKINSQPQSKPVMKKEIIPQDQKQELVVDKANRLAEEQKSKVADVKQQETNKSAVEKQEASKEANSPLTKSSSSVEKSAPSIEKGKATNESSGAAATTESLNSSTSTESEEKSTPSVTEKSPSTTPAISSSTDTYKTETGGKLPATAGNNVNYGFFGLLCALMGVLLHKRKESDF